MALKPNVKGFPQVFQTHFTYLLPCHFILKLIILPRQARDKHRERALKNRCVLLQVFHTERRKPSMLKGSARKRLHAILLS